MKRILYLLCIGSVMLALTAAGAPPDKANPKGKGRGKASAQVTASPKGKATLRGGGTARTQRSVARPYARSKATVSRATVRPDRGRIIRKPSVVAKSKVRTSRDVAVSRERAFTGAGDQIGSRRAVAVAGERNFRAHRSGRFDRNRNVRITNNWRDSRFAGAQYAAFRDYRRVYRDRDWYRHTYTRIIFVSGGWWYWNTGYWYPAWGYVHTRTIRTTDQFTPVTPI
jgi:hypothetical protein